MNDPYLDYDNEKQNDQLKKYWLVIEYVDGDALRKYLKENFDKLTWDDKYKFAYQLANAVSYLHEEGIVHHDLVADFELSKRIEEATKKHSEVFGVLPYVDPKRFNRQWKYDNILQPYTLNEKSDVYSISVLLWKISSDRLLFYVESVEYNITLAIDILQGLRESIIPDTPEFYVNIYIVLGR
ncbi:16690_t:CDS:2 [Funneliformis geosporum]|nr:16690_t:CDS:2 [Funneliformis geosporum]